MFNRTHHPVFMGLVAGALLHVATPAFAIDSDRPDYVVDSAGVPVKSGNHTPKTPDCVISTHAKEKLFAECGDIPPDSDGDGVLDPKDKCPGTPEGTKVDADGCPLDSDKDGVANDTDNCPNNTPTEISAGVYKSGPKTGCPVDSDGDGVPDYRDKCPNTPAGTSVDTDGCAVVTGVIESVLTEDHIRFDFDKAILKPAGKAIVDKMVSFLNKDIAHVKEVLVVGHTDRTGPADYNQSLSQRRAQSVADYITNGGVPTSVVVVVGKGESDPVSNKNTKEGRSANRRVEITVRKTNK